MLVLCTHASAWLLIDAQYMYRKVHTKRGTSCAISFKTSLYSGRAHIREPDKYKEQYKEHIGARICALILPPAAHANRWRAILISREYKHGCGGRIAPHGQ